VAPYVTEKAQRNIGIMVQGKKKVKVKFYYKTPQITDLAGFIKII
jgi:hypothetical protein